MSAHANSSGAGVGSFFSGLVPGTTMSTALQLFERYCELQSYVGWTEEDAKRLRALAPRLEPFLGPLIDDFYDEIERHPNARKVITGGAAQIERLKGTLNQWIRELFTGRYDVAYVERRWKVGWRHVEIGLDQVYSNVALSRLRTGLTRAVQETWSHSDSDHELEESIQSLNKLLDLDLAIIEDAYQEEHVIRLQRSERLATLGQVAGGVAHELRNPLNVVKTSAFYLLNARNPTAEKRAEHLKRIERQVELADRVITALSSFAKMPVPSLRPLSVDSVVQDAIEANPPGENIVLEIDLPESLPPILADRAQILVVFGNLIRNARDAMLQGGRMSIIGTQIGDAVELAVADTGVGIPQDDLGRIMEPLYSTKARGLGLGLSIARSILERNRGTLLVKSELGKGSTFTVRLAAAGAEGVSS
jgi:signal transduction histidine kinase